jgi:hypothetical protein
MTFIEKLLGKEKKKELKARCPITKEAIEKGYGYLITTADVVSSRKYWDMIMTEPETLSYTISHERPAAWPGSARRRSACRTACTVRRP